MSSNIWFPFIRRFIAKLSISLVVLVLLFLLCLWGLFSVADMIFYDKDHSLDQRVFAFIKPNISPAMTGFMSTVTFFGSQDFLLPASLFLVIMILVIKKTRWDALKVVAIVISSRIVLYTLKFLIQRERPLLPLIAKEHGYSFPSGHTFSSVIFYGIIGYICYKKISNPFLRWTCILLVLFLTVTIGFSRIYLRFHYASDVVAGFCLGIIWLLLARWILVSAQKRSKTPVVPVGR